MNKDDTIGFDKTVANTDSFGGYSLMVGELFGQYKIIKALGRGGI